MVKKIKNNSRSFGSGFTPKGSILSVTFYILFLFIIFSIFLIPVVISISVAVPNGFTYAIIMIIITYGSLLLVWLLIVIISIYYQSTKTNPLNNKYEVNVKTNSIFIRNGQFSDSIPINKISSIKPISTIFYRFLLSLRFNNYYYFGSLGSETCVLIKFNNSPIIFNQSRTNFILDIDDPELFIKVLSPLIRNNN